MDYARKARNLRRTSIGLFVGAAIFAGLGIAFIAITGQIIPNVLTLASAVIIAISGMSFRVTASRYDQMAQRRY